ncbi:MAG: thermonuclease family protein [Chthoniobacterales bacterium]|nr:thermonuclease family protein [Chthoniobacterales bacterium]
MNRRLRFAIVLALAGVVIYFATLRVSTVPATSALATPVPGEEQTSEERKPIEKATPGAAPRAKPFQRLDGCRLIPNRWNDGDSFHVMTADAREIIVRVYFVDTPEAETAYRDRIAEQAAYFGISSTQAVEIAHEATAFTAQRLAGTFTVWTRWRSALGRSALGRVNGIVIAEGEDLNEALVANGLARIYGTRTALFDGRDSRAYLARLHQLEEQAKREHKGAWRFTP